MNEIRFNESLHAVASHEVAAAARAKSHVVTLDGGEWPLWRWAGLRGAGFPVEQVLKLSSPAAAAAADWVLQLEDETKRARSQAVKLVNCALDARHSGAVPQDQQQRDSLVTTLRRLKMAKPANPTGVDRVLDTALEELSQLSAKIPQAAQAFEESFTAALVEGSLRVREVAGEGRFQEAVIWQNRHAFHTAVLPLLRHAPETGPPGSKQRQLEELVANYLQRYCVKNDTIGFFGPVGWAKLGLDGPAFTAKPGPDLIAERKVYLEVWCMDVLAEALARNESLKIWYAPRRVSYLNISGNILHLPAKKPLKLPAEQAAVLQACDGVCSAREIARRLLMNPYLKLKSESDVYELLEQLCREGMVVWKLEVPIESYPERTLRRTLEGVEDEELRHSTLAALGEIEQARGNVERAVNAPELDLAISELEQNFTRLTGSASTRSAGEMYAGRTLVYEDCRRDLDVEIGPDVLNSLGPPLSLLLSSARWFTHRIAAVTRDIFARLYREISRRTNSSIVDFPTLWYRLYPVIFSAEQQQPLHQLLPVFQERWARVFSIPAGVRRAAFTSADLQARVMAEFSAPDSGWKSAIYHSPDIMIAAADGDAIRRGDYQFVLGEMHASVNTLRSAFFRAHHPSPEDLDRFFDLDHDTPRAVPLIPKAHWPAKTARLLPVLVAPGDFRIEFAPEPYGVKPSRILPFGSLLVEECGGEVIVRTRDGRLRFDPLDVFSDTPTLSAANGFKLLPESSHAPRVSIDRLVVCRESWAFNPDEITCAQEKTNSARFLASRRWAREHGIPRFAFVKATTETKPIFVDFDSPTYVNIFAKVVRRVRGTPDARIAVSEMLPTPDQSWLTCAAGQHYTSELRMVAVDAPRRG